ncbi:11645_t:CDS:1 [Paraglomus brasilianum]|uniref:Protein YOP1 n=1 Tax=Paraglomus brasilianum TaxID=144538 RepID=A0A9N8ZLW9_9GLOM|nr:11645_t:CDS:1 [Paraglomus brasilianum]
MRTIADIEVESSTKKKQTRQPLSATACLEEALTKLEFSSPLNLSPLTEVIRQQLVSRISELEKWCTQTRMHRTLVRWGVPPLYVFLFFAALTLITIRRMYVRSVYLLCNLVGVVYPAYKSIKAIDHVGPIEGEAAAEQRQWLTYWAIYGWLQVADYWSNWFLELFPGYNFFKLVLLYWAQSDRSKGATLIFEHIIKPFMHRPANKDLKKHRQRLQPQASQQNQAQQRPFNQNGENACDVDRTDQPSVTSAPDTYVAEPSPEEIWQRDAYSDMRKNNVNIKPYKLEGVS